MKTFSDALKAHYAQELTTIGMCWRCTLSNGTVYGFTNAAADILYGGVTYLASTGFTPSAIQTSSQFNVDNLEVSGILSASCISEADLLAGLWDYAAVSIFEINYMDTSMGINRIRDGFLGQVSTARNIFHTELRGLHQYLQQPTGRSMGVVCDANFCDTRCGLAVASWTSTGLVTSVVAGRTINCVLSQPSWTYTGGLLTMTSGAANGFKMEIRSNPSTSQVVLQELFPYTPNPGDTFSIVAGCTKQHTTCADTYHNIINFRGYHSLPGQDAVISGT